MIEIIGQNGKSGRTSKRACSVTKHRTGTYPNLAMVISGYEVHVHRAQRTRYKSRQTSLERTHTEMVTKDDTFKEEVN